MPGKLPLLAQLLTVPQRFRVGKARPSVPRLGNVSTLEIVTVSGDTIVLDAIDRRILTILYGDARTTWTKVAEEVGLSGPSTVDRVRKLERLGVIRGYEVRADPLTLGCSLLAFVSVAISDPACHDDVLRWAADTTEVQECHVVAGGFDYLLKVRCRDTTHLENLILHGLRATPGVVRTHSTIVMATKKETSALPLPPE